MSDNIKPRTRTELFLAATSDKSIQVPKPRTRQEMFLQKVAQSNGGVTSWNDLPDRPFGEEWITDSLTTMVEPSETTTVVYSPLVGYLENRKLYVHETHRIDVFLNGVLYKSGTMQEIDSNWYVVADGEKISKAVKVDRVSRLFQPEIYIPPLTETTAVKVDYAYLDKIVTLDTKFLPEHLQFGSGYGAVLKECSLTYSEDDNAYVINTSGLDLTVGKTYTVNWNGVAYECICQDGSVIQAGAVVLGNGEYLGLASNGEPFAIMSIPGRGAVAATFDGSTEATISIYGEIIIPIQKKYLPISSWEGLGSEYDLGYALPETTPAFNETEGYFTLAKPFTIYVGETYTVNWNGVDYTCECVTAKFSGLPILGLGNIGAVTGGTPTAEPFAIGVILEQYRDQAPFAVGIIPLDDSESVTLSVYGNTEIITPVPKKYLPEDIGGVYKITEEFTLNTDGEAELTTSYDEFMPLLWNGGRVVICHSLNGVYAEISCNHWEYDSANSRVKLFAQYSVSYVVLIFPNGTWTPPV